MIESLPSYVFWFVALFFLAILYYYLLLRWSFMFRQEPVIARKLKYCAAPWNWALLWSLSTLTSGGHRKRVIRNFLFVGVTIFTTWIGFAIALISNFKPI